MACITGKGKKEMKGKKTTNSGMSKDRRREVEGSKCVCKRRYAEKPRGDDN